MRLFARDDIGEDDAAGSATLTAHFFEDVLGAGVDQEFRHSLAERAGLIGRCAGALLDVLVAVDGADAGVKD